MSTEFSEKARWAKLAGLSKTETPKVESESKQQLDENVVGIGAINNPFPTRKPNDYELAFEHFLGEMYSSKKKEVKEEKEEKVSEDKIEKVIKAVLKKEGGAAGLDPIKDAVMDLDVDKDFNLKKFIKGLKSVEQHKHGDYILKEEVTEEMTDAEKEKVEKEVDAVRDDLDQISKLAKDAGEDAEDIKDMVDEAGFGKMSTDGTAGFGNMLYKGMDEMYKKYGEEMVDEVLEMYHSKMKKDKGMEENSTTDAKFQKTGFAEEMKKGMEKLPKSIRDKEKTDIEKDAKKALGMTEEEMKMSKKDMDEEMKMSKKGMGEEMKGMKEAMMMMSLDDLMKMKAMVDNMMMMRES